MGNCLETCNNGGTEGKEEFSRDGSSMDLSYDYPPIAGQVKMERGTHDGKSKKGSRISEEVQEDGVGVVRVRIVLSKKEAAQLLSKCEGGGDGGLFGEVMRELKRIDGGDRINGVAQGPCRCSWRPVLESIPENP